MLPAVPHDGSGKLALDIGAGTARDAAWFAGIGYQVVAAEPAAGMRRVAVARHGNLGVRWIDDALPGLERTHALGLSFDLILLSPVMTPRNGPAAPGMEMHPTSTTEVEGLARSYGLEVLRVAPSPDQGGRPGVTWAAMAMRMPDDGALRLDQGAKAQLRRGP